jgi:hypothetical protein
MLTRKFLPKSSLKFWKKKHILSYSGCVWLLGLKKVLTRANFLLLYSVRFIKKRRIYSDFKTVEKFKQILPKEH